MQHAPRVKVLFLTFLFLLGLAIATYGKTTITGNMGSPASCSFDLVYQDEGATAIRTTEFSDSYKGGLFNRKYGFPDESRKSGRTATLMDIIPVSNGGFLAVGEIISDPEDKRRSSDAWMVRLNERGDIQWQKTFYFPTEDEPTTSFDDHFRSVVETDDGGFLTTGRGTVWGSDAYGEGSRNSGILIVKTNASGNLQWFKLFKNLDASAGNGERVCRIPDGNYLIIGDSVVYFRNENDQITDTRFGGTLIKISSDGNVIFNKTLCGDWTISDNWHFSDVAVLDDGSIMATGWASVAPYSEGWGSDGLLLVKFNADGAISWTKKFDNLNGWNVGDYGSRILATSDGVYVAGVTGIGRTWVNNPVILGKFTTAGVVSWVKTYWAVTTSNVTDLISSRDGNLLLSSGQYSDILKLDPSGAPIWGRNAVNNAASSLHLMPNEGLVSCGGVYDVGFWLSHSTITTYDDDGNSCANYYNPGTFKATASDETEFLGGNAPVVASTTIPSAGYELQVSDGPGELSTYKACRMSESGDSDCLNSQIFLTPTDEYEDMVSGGTPTPGGYAERRWELHFEGAVSDIVVSFVDDDGNPSSGQVDTISGQYPMPEEVYPLYSYYSTGYITYVLGVGTGAASLINDSEGGIPDTQSPGVLYLWGEGFDGSSRVYLSIIQPDGEVIVLNWDPDTGATTVVKDTSGKYTTACSDTPIYDHVLYFPHIRSDGQWESEVCIINTASKANVSGTLTGYDAAGNSISFLGFSLPPGGRQEFTIGNSFSNADRIRYMTYECDSDAVKGYLKLYVGGKYRVAMPAVDKVNTDNIYVSHIASSTTWKTEIALLNTTNIPITVSIEFSDGTIKKVTLAGKEQKFLSVADLFGGVSQPGVNSAVITNASGIVGLELFSADAQNLLSGILLQDSLTTHMYYPHTASENGWATGVVAYNPSDSLCYIIFTPYDADGNLLDAFAPSIPVESKTQYVGLIRNLDLPAGTAWVVVASSAPITGFELFTRTNAMAGYTGVNISGKTGIFPKIEKASSAGTGIAFVNLENADATVTLTAMNDAGRVVAEQTLLLTKFQKRVEMVQNLFDSDISTATYVAYECDRLVVGFQLNVNGIMLDGLPGM